MLKKTKIKILILLISIMIISGHFFISTLIGNDKFGNLRGLLNVEQKNFIKKYFFPQKLISQQQRIIFEQQDMISEQKQMIDLFNKKLGFIDKENGYHSPKKNGTYTKLELSDKDNDVLIPTIKKTEKIFDDNKIDKYKLNAGFYSGINNIFPGSGYIDFHEGNMILLSSRGILAFKKNIEDTEENFQQIKNNINEFININQYKKNNWFSLKDIFIFNNKIFISFTEEIKEDCWNTSVIFADINYEIIKFKKIFSPKECVHSTLNIDKEFNAHQSGGRIIAFDNNHILLSVGDYRSRQLVQNIKSVNGKIIKINIDNGNYKIISLGHRNPQGLYFDKENNFLLETEHGPKGGDEINLIEISDINKDIIPNYGWPISSAGELEIDDIEKSKKYPMYKSHSEHGFIEPLKSFVPSIGISEIVKVEKNRYVASSMRDRSLYFFELNKQKQIINLNRVEVFERVRDLRFYNNLLYLFMEDTASIGVMDLN